MAGEKWNVVLAVAFIVKLPDSSAVNIQSFRNGATYEA